MTAIDAFTSPTLKHLRESWWDDDFTEFLRETLRPRPGNRILDVGCGEGLAEVSLGHLHISQLRQVGIDLVPSKVARARQETASHNQRAWFAAADACRLPFASGSFDALYCVAVLQHIRDVQAAVQEFARVTARGGRIVAVEPDNSARYVFSSVVAGMRAFELAAKFFRVAASTRGDTTDHAIGPALPQLFMTNEIEPVAVRLFPVSHAQLGAPDPAIWAERRRAADAALASAPEAAHRVGRAYAEALQAYEAEATAAGAAFVEIQNSMLIATVCCRV
jgi:ubiquinone/menaquinone biosynthesis C-methylase UbiE